MNDLTQHSGYQNTQAHLNDAVDAWPESIEETMAEYANLMKDMAVTLRIKGELEGIISSHVEENGSVSHHGWSAKQVERKTTNHEAAAEEYGVKPSLVVTHTTTKTSTAWAKITKDAGIPKDIIGKHTISKITGVKIEEDK